MRALIAGAALLCATPCLAVDGDGEDGLQVEPDRFVGGDGVYEGFGEFAGGNSKTCRGMGYTIEVKGGEAMATLRPPSGSREITASGTLKTDGTLAMSYDAGNRSGRVDIQLKLEDATFTGYSQSEVCRYRIVVPLR
jgi:hypothetical protein